MKVGILTFHWATNYGAILQCFALQSYLKEQGHCAEVINYKPKRYDKTIFKSIRTREIFHLKTFLCGLNKEKELSKFRKEHLHLTHRFYEHEEVAKIVDKYDVIISGSDQILNPYFLLEGENNTYTPIYFQPYLYRGLKVAYAVSFGCTIYPQKASDIASKLIVNFDKISVREKSGVDIVNGWGRFDVELVPDPTLLVDKKFYENIIKNKLDNRNYVYAFFIRNIEERKKALHAVLDYNVIINNDSNKFSLEDWLSRIAYSSCLITDSFHAMVMALKLEVPFVIITNDKGNAGMNDRFYSILSFLELEERIIYKEDICSIKNIMSQRISWDDVRCKLNLLKERGVKFLSDALTI